MIDLTVSQNLLSRLPLRVFHCLPHNLKYWSELIHAVLLSVISCVFFPSKCNTISENIEIFTLYLRIFPNY